MSPRRRLAGLVQGLPQTAAALEFAQRVHAGQVRRLDDKPFVWHPIEVAWLLRDSGAPDHLVAAGLLHDVIEKTDTSPGELSEAFGALIVELVLAVSEDESISNYQARKAGLRRQVAAAGCEAQLLFAADKVAKVREFRAEYFVPGTPRARRVTHYRRCLKLLEEQIPDEWLVHQLRIEFEHIPTAFPVESEAYSSARPPSTASVSPVT